MTRIRSLVADDLITALDDVHALEVEAARMIVGKAVQEAAANWIPPLAVRDALMAEIAALDASGMAALELADHLRRLADRLETATGK